MRYLIALLCPPLAILMCGRPFLAIFSVLLCVFYFPAALLALLIVAEYYADHRFDRMIRESLKIERSYMKIWKSHIKAVNRSIDEDTKMARQERKLAAKAASSASATPAPQAQAQAPTPKPPRRPLITREGIRSAGMMIKEMAVLAKDQAVHAYQALPEWAQPITWGLAAGSAISIPFLLFMVVRH